jgi:hypothetical protein
MVPMTLDRHYSPKSDEIRILRVPRARRDRTNIPYVSTRTIPPRVAETQVLPKGKERKERGKKQKKSTGLPPCNSRDKPENAVRYSLPPPTAPEVKKAPSERRLVKLATDRGRLARCINRPSYPRQEYRTLGRDEVRHRETLPGNFSRQTGRS